MLQCPFLAIAFILLAAAPAAAAGPRRGPKTIKGPSPGHVTARVRVAPPAAVVEKRPQQPSPRHVWLPGYWVWRGGKHAWIGGGWTIPPRPGYVWVPARWTQQGDVWVFEEGRWEPAPPAAAAPPAPALQRR